MTLQEFNSRYVYQSDINKFGFDEVWEVPELQDGKYYGDCESYCLFLKKNVDGFKDWKLYFCRLSGDGHCVLYKDGGVIDCNTKEVVNYSRYCSVYEVTGFKKQSWFTLFGKMVLTKWRMLWLKR